jgi:hypothetical protein
MASDAEAGILQVEGHRRKSICKRTTKKTLLSYRQDGLPQLGCGGLSKKGKRYLIRRDHIRKDEDM